LKRILIISGLLFIVLLDIYLAGTFLFSSKKKEKEVIVLPSKNNKETVNIKENSPDQTEKKKEIKKEDTSEKIQNQIKSEIKNIKNKKNLKNMPQKIKNMSSKEIDQLIEKIIEEARQEYYYSKEKEKKRSIIEKLFHFGD